MAKIPVSVQMYTLRDLSKNDFAGTVKQVAKIGYAGVELAGYGNLKSAAEAKKVLDDAGLKVSGSHVSIDILEKNLDQALDEAAALGNSFIVCPWLPDSRRQGTANWKQLAQSLNQIGQTCRQRGLTLAYHNHSFEFQQFDGQFALDILFANSDPKNVQAELDVYWVQHGKQDPIAYINKYAGRLPLLHLKDMGAGPEQRFAPVGSGILNMKGILAAAQKAGVKWYVVEQDSSYEQAPMDAVRTSFENLKKLGAV